MTRLANLLAYFTLLFLSPSLTTITRSQLFIVDPLPALPAFIEYPFNLTMSTTLHEHPSEWHPGEAAIHALLHVPQREMNPTSRGLPPPYAYRVTASPLVAFGTVDDQSRPWTTVWGGERQFTRPIAQSVLGVRSLVDIRHDPVLDALFEGKKDGDLVRPLRDGDQGKMMAGLSIDLETRDRVKLAGRMVAGAVSKHGGEENAEGGVGEMQLAMLVQESLGNCPKYLNKKAIRPHMPSPTLAADTLPLPEEAIDLVDRADLFFLSSTDGNTMDTNHRGGPPGFVRVVSNSAANGVSLIYPEFSGNRLYQSLGNLHVKPLVGVVIPDFETGDVLYLTGQTKILIGEQSAAYLPHTKLAVKIEVTAARYVKDGLPFRGEVIDYSPYNPPVRHLATETALSQGDSSKPTATVVLKDRESLTPTISRFTFMVELIKKGELKVWEPGQYITLDFAPELDVGWSHMRDDDPQSLNDDFIRTFTVSSVPPETDNGLIPEGAAIELTLRKHGPATGLLFGQNLRVPLELPVLGFGGEFRIPTSPAGDEREKEAVFVAAGVGITPLLAQAPGVLAAGGKLKVLWTLRGEDLPLAVDSFKRIKGLAKHVRLHVTGEDGKPNQKLLDEVKLMAAEVAIGRITKNDVLRTGQGQRKFYLCTGPELLKSLLQWLEGEEVVWESFGY